VSENNIDFKGLAAQLMAGAEDFLIRLFPQGKKNGHEWEVGSLDGNPGDSLKINIRTGLWKDFATGEAGGDLISLYAAAKGLRQGEAFKELCGDTGKVVQPIKPADGAALATIADKKTPAGFIPLFFDKEKLPKNKDAIVHPKHGKPKYLYPYRSATGDILFFVCRFELDPEPYMASEASEPGKIRKEFSAYSYGQFGKRIGWHWKSWPDNRPLFGLNTLAATPASEPVVVVEGEKACNAAKKIFQEQNIPCVTWASGAQAFKKTDWEPLTGRKIIFWPDNDEPGRTAMNNVALLLQEKGISSSFQIVVVPDGKPKGWDAADYLAEINSLGSGENIKIDPFVPVQKSVEISTPAQVKAENDMLSRFDDMDGADIAAFYDAEPPAELSSKAALNLPHYIRNRPLMTVSNLAMMLKSFNVEVKYNVISKNMDYTIPGMLATDDNRDEKCLSWIASKCIEIGMGTDHLDRFVLSVADDHYYNPVAEWIAEKPWDGIRRLGEFFDTVKSTNEPLKEILMTRWLISAVAAAFEPKGISSGGILVFAGAQYVGKTFWFKRLVPNGYLSEYIKDGLNLNPSDKDSVKRCISKWLVELGELDATFRKADIAALKAFITANRDIIRLPYGRTERSFPRRTIFFASVNHIEFLRDETGNRRYWTIECLAINNNHTIDMQQVWAEVYELYKAGEPWHLSHAEVEMLNKSNEDFEAHDTLEDRIRTFYDWTKPCLRFISYSVLLEEIGIKHPNKGDAVQAGLIATKLNGGKKRRTGVKRLVAVPEKDDFGQNQAVTGSNVSFKFGDAEGFD